MITYYALVVPFLSLFYAVVAAVFLWVWGEGLLIDLLASTAPHWAVAGVALGCHHVETPPSIILAILINLAGFGLLLYTRRYTIVGGKRPSLQHLPDGAVVVITGANAGIGFETARQLLQVSTSIQLILACRSKTRASAAKQLLLQHSPSAKILITELDLCSLSSVRLAADQVRQRYPKIHLLINNAGVMMADHRQTVDGLELVMQANHLGHYLWTRLLTDRMAPHGRILNLTSCTYTLCKQLPDDLLCKERSYSLFGQYATSKLCNILFTAECARRYPNIASHAIHPGLVRTDVVRNMPIYLRLPNQLFAFVLRTLQKTPQQGAWNTLHVAAGMDSQQAMDLSGRYWVNQRPQALRPAALDVEAANRLWRESAQLVGLAADHNKDTNGQANTKSNGHSNGHECPIS